MESFLLAIGTLGFIAATAYFIFLMPKAPATSRRFFIITAVITGVAGFFYLRMAVVYQS